ncbi:tudor domain-containing protein 15 [Coregonus clupeaformis]|uniref:tudor domain-containing protein 15 n=1 Tax=Coregonus clupeaformis TaxID=59861 RepID=UPI001BE10282|nr:tudor domain-containing protein 15 [Coregonus clupeaformis]
MLLRMTSENRKPQEDSSVSAQCSLWPVDLQLTHVSCNPGDTLVHFQGQYLTICELDYNILQVEIQNAQKTKVAVEVGEFCLVEDIPSTRWYRGRVQNKQKDLFDVFLIDHGNVLSVDASHLATALDELFMLPPKILCGFFANVLPLRENWDSFSEKYFASLIGSHVKGYIQAFLPHKVLILEAPDINKDLFRLSLGKHVDTDTFLLLVEMLTEVPLKQSIEPVPDLLIEKQGGQEFSFKPSSLKGFEDIQSFSGPKLTTGKKVRVRVTAAVNPVIFYCQMTSMAKDLKRMSDKLALSCESKSKDPSQKPAENLGLLCSVKGKDEKWHRGFVQFLPVNSQVRVLFVDYGFCESVKIENVLQLPPDFLSTPIMAFPCALSCLNGQDQAVKIQQLTFFKKGLLGRVLDVEINGFDKEQNLYLVTVLSAEDYAVVEAGPIQDVPGQRECDFILESEPAFPLNGYLYYETAIIQAMDNSVIVEEMQEDSVFEGYVEHVLNPGAFWLRTQKRNKDFEEMMENMAKHFSQVQLDEEIIENPEPGALCCAMYELDMHYYRAMVTDTLDNGAEVFFIDFGNTEKVPHMCIKQIPEKFAIEPAFALSCSLVNVMPFDDVWTISATDYFRRAVSNKTLLVHVVHIRKDLYVVDLYESENNTSQRASKSITELLTTTNHAEFWKYTPSAPVIPKREMEKEMMKQKTCKKGQVHANGSSTSGVTRKPPKETWEISELDGCEKKPESPKSSTLKDKAPAVKFKAQKFKPGSELAVRCSHVNTPSEFWCQLESKIPNLEEMMEAIQQYYQAHTLPVQSSDSCCVTKSKDDGRWYRACIVGAQKDEVEMIFVDYGIVAKEKVHNLQAIVPEFLDLEGQAFRCSLYNLIEPARGSGGDWGTEACDLLKYFAQGQSVKLTCCIHAQLYVKNKGLCNVVDLHNTQQNATKKLVEKGLAREVQTPMQLMPSVCPDSFVHSSFNLRCGSEEQVCVTHVCSPWEMYCQLDRNTEMIEDLMEKVAMESEEILRANSGPGIGKLCLAKYYGDGKWYRGVACPVQSTLLLNVFFVDYGNMHIVEKTNVVPIPRHSADLLFTPMQALRCSLSQIPKEENFADVNKWLEKSILNKPLRAVVAGKNEDGTVSFDLFDGGININEKVKELIASQKPKEKKSNSRPVTGHEGHKEQTKNKTGKTKDRQHLKPTGKGVTCHNKHQHQNKQSSNAQKANPPKCPDAQQDWEEQSEIITQFKAEESTEGKTDQHDVDSSSKVTETVCSVQLPKLSQLLPNPKIKSGFRGLGFVSHINTVDSFFIQMQDDKQSILKMGEDLNTELFKETMGNNSTLVDFRMNDLVAAEYEEDGALYRAVVTDNASNDHFKVEFVDYGNTATVTKDKMYTLTSVFLLQHRLSIPCSLLNSDSYESDASFTDAVMGKPLMVEIVSRFGTQWEVNVEIQQDNPTLDNDVTENEEVQALCASLVDTVKKQTRAAIKDNSQSNTHSERVMFTAQGEKVLLNVSPMPSPTRHKHGICKHQDSNQLQSTTFGPSMEAMKDMAIPSQDIRAGQAESGTLLSILENGDLYLRLHRTTEQFTVLENLIVENWSKCKVMSEKNVKEGLQCLAKSTKDDQWHRAVVRHASIDQGKCGVLLVDHGTTEDVPMGCIKDICNDLKQTPVQAVLCKWNGPGFPISDAYEILKKTLKPMVGKDMKLMFVSYSEADNLWMVEIMMNGLFLAQQMKIATSECTEERPIPTKTQTVTPTEKKPSLDNSPQRLFLAPVNMDLGYSGFAAAVTTPSEFYIVLEDLLLIMNTVSTILEDLPKELLPLHEEHLIRGSCCLVRSDSKNKWCRAEIVHSDRAVVVINLVDYGHCVDMPYKDWSELRRLPDQLTRLPKVTYPCTLRGVKSVEGQWTDEAVVFFQECICKKNLKIYFRQYVSEAHWEVDIVADGVHVAKDLVDAGHAEYIDIMLGLRFQEQSPIRVPQQKQGMSRAEKTPKAEPKMTPPRTNILLRRLNEELELNGHISSEVAFCGQGFEKASEKTASATENSDGQGAEKMTHPSTMTGTRHCKYLHLLIFIFLHVG